MYFKAEYVATTRGASATDTTVTINKGAAGGAGVAISYDMASERTQAVNAIDGTTETYTYTADGYLAVVVFNDGCTVMRTNDALGRVTNYSELNAAAVQTYGKVTAYDKDNRTTQETGTDGTTTFAYNANGGELSLTSNLNSGNTINTYYAYSYGIPLKKAHSPPPPTTQPWRATTACGRLAIPTSATMLTATLAARSI